MAMVHLCLLGCHHRARIHSGIRHVPQDVSTTFFIAYRLTHFLLRVTVHVHDMKTMNGSWLSPFGALIVDGSAGSLMIPLLGAHNKHIAMFTALWALMTLIIGFSICCLILAILLQRMFVDGLPPAKHIWTSWSPLSVATQTGFTLIAICGGFNGLLPVHYGKSAFLTHPAAGEVILGIGLAVGVCLWMISFFCLIFAIVSMLYGSLIHALMVM